MEKRYILNFWYGDGFGGTPFVLSSRSDAEEMALACHQWNLYEYFLRCLMVDGDAVKDALRWAYDDVVEYSIQEAAAFL